MKILWSARILAASTKYKKYIILTSHIYFP